MFHTRAEPSDTLLISLTGRYQFPLFCILNTTPCHHSISASASQTIGTSRSRIGRAFDSPLFQTEQSRIVRHSDQGRGIRHSSDQRLAAHHKFGNSNKQLRSAFQGVIALSLDLCGRSSLVLCTHSPRNSDLSEAFFQKQAYHSH